MKKTYIVSIAGGSASGKSTLTEMLKECLMIKGISVRAISMDSYFLPESELPIAKSPINGKEYRDYNHPSSFDLQKLNRKLDELSESNEYQVIIVEGLLTLWDKALSSKSNMKIFVDCRADERIVRRLKRNMQWGLTFDEIAEVYLDLVRFRHDEYVEPTKNMADLVVNGSKDFSDPCEIILSYILNQL